MKTKQELREGKYEDQRRKLIKDKSTKCLLDNAIECDLIKREYLVDLIHESNISYEEIETWQ